MQVLFKNYMSPYQTQVIDASLAEFDRNAAANRQRIRDQAVASGAFGGGREGVELAEYQTGSDMDRAMLQANLLQQGFESAAARRQQDLANQQGLAQLLPQLQRADISTLGSVGAVQQAQQQAEEDATREAARQATFLPQENLSRYAGQVAGLMGGYPGQTTQSFVPNPSPLQTAIGAGFCTSRYIRSVKRIMNRILKRPMFRMGGSPQFEFQERTTGVLSGLDGPKLNASRTGYG